MLVCEGDHQTAFTTIQVVVGDLLSYDDMRRVVKGTDYMYFTFAVQDGLLEGSTIAAVVAAEAGDTLNLPDPT